MTAIQFTTIFLSFLFIKTLLELWLKTRHIHHIRRHQAIVPAAFAHAITLEQHQRAASYSIDKARTQMVISLVEAMLLLFFTLGGGIEWLIKLTQAWFSDDRLSGMMMIGGVIVFHHLIMLPFSIYQTFVIEARHGFNKMTLGLFIADMIKTLVLSALIGFPILWVLLTLMRHAGDGWWLYAWLFWVGLSFALMAIYPTVIAPLFNKFEPLQDYSLKERIEALFARCGFTSRGIFVMDGSRRSQHGNAYFTGIGKSKRIVFFDTLLAHLDPPEVEAVLAHELGHFKKKHIIKRLLTSFVFTLGLFWLLGQLLHSDWFFYGLGVYTLNNATALTLFSLATPIFIFLLTPMSSFTSRQHEFEADAYAAQEAKADDLIRALVKLYRDNASPLTPDPLHSLFYDSHPPASLRIAALQQRQP
jgi:STE24 endopeptidase